MGLQASKRTKTNDDEGTKKTPKEVSNLWNYLFSYLS